MRPVAPRVHPGHWHVLRSMRRQRGGADYGRAELAARWRASARRAAAGIGARALLRLLERELSPLRRLALGFAGRPSW